MGKIWVKEFTGGLDTRRMAVTTPGGVLIEAHNGHFTRGGEFEKRAAFVPTYELPPGTIGLAYGKTGIYVFGHEPDPGMPTGVNYQQLQHPDGVTPLIDVPSFDLNAGKIYAVGVFTDGTRHHFYDGVRVEDWFDGRARVSFRVTDGGARPAVSAQGSFSITAGTSGVGNQITSVKVNGVTITSGAIAHTGNNATTAEAVATDINATTTSPDYSAYAENNVVNIVAELDGPGPNGYAVLATPGGDATVGSTVNMAGGMVAGTSKVTGITINGVPIIFGEVEWRGDNSTAAADLAAAISSSASTPEYDAISVEDQVVILAAAPGEEENDKAVIVSTAFGYDITPATGLAMGGGASADDTFAPGTFVKTVGSKMLCVSGPNLHGSGIKQPTQWTTAAVGAFFIDMSSQASGSEELKAVATYQNFVAVFSETNIQIEYLDPDPTLNRFVQVLSNTGTASPLSVTKFGDDDLFYLNESGLRSLRARDSSNAAATNDIGVPVDTLVTAKLRTLSSPERDRITGVIEQQDGRFWLAMKDLIFTFSFFDGAKVSAWSTYTPSIVVDGVETSFPVEQTVAFNRRIYIRSGDMIYVYGGLGEEQVYDDTVAVVGLPYLDGDTPTQKKGLTGFDAAAEGEWIVFMRMDVNNIEAKDKIGTLVNSTFQEGRVPGNGQSTHYSPLLMTKGSGPARLGSIIIHHDGDADED